jgi:nucleoid-associated protein YgaU
MSITPSALQAARANLRPTPSGPPAPPKPGSLPKHSAMWSPATASLRQKDNKSIKVELQFNPTSIKISHSVTPTVAGSGKTAQSTDGGQQPRTEIVVQSTEQAITNAGKTTIILPDIWFDGPSATVLDQCGQLLLWSYGVVHSDDKKAYMPVLQFAWGDFRIGASATPAIDVQLYSVTVSYERFTSTGAPIRAKVTLSMQCVSEDPLSQNPTSGGVPARHVRTLVSGENLQALATDAYGSPQSWRNLAEANGIDDPLRVRPGSLIYLPARTDLDAKSPR